MKNDIEGLVGENKRMKKKKWFIFISLLTGVSIIVGASIIYRHIEALKNDEEEVGEIETVSNGALVNGNNSTNTSESVMKTSESTVPKSKEEPESNSLKGRKILCIGDSMTYLDNKEISVGKIIGYQQVFRNEGAVVDSYGISGSTFKQYSEEMSKRKHNSLYDDVVLKKKANIKDHDYITIFAGTNDISSNFIIGDHSTLDNPKTTLGAFNLLLNYLKERTNARIVVFSPIYTSNLKDRPKEDMEKLVEEMRYVTHLNQIEFVDMYHHFEINQETSEKYLYDKLHPNNKGMALIGEEMAEVIKTPRLVELPKKE